MAPAPYAPGPADHLVEFYLEAAEPWRAKDLTATLGAAPLSGSPTGRGTSASLFARGPGRHLIQYRIQGASSWTATDVTARAGGNEIGGDPSATLDGRSVFAARPDGHLGQFYLNAASTWEWWDVSELAGGHPIFGGPVTLDGRSVWCEDIGGHFVQFFFNDSSHWEWWDISEMSGGPSIASRVSAPGRTVFARDSRGHLVGFYATVTGAWEWFDLTDRAAGQTIVGDPWSPSFRSVFACAPDGRLLQWWNDDPDGDAWRLWDISAFVGGQRIASNPVTPPDGRSVFAVTPGRHLVQFFFNASGRWELSDISEFVGAVVGGNPTIGVNGHLFALADIFDVHGPVREAWKAQGFEKGPLGYAIGDQGVLGALGAICHFQGGSILYHPNTGAHVVIGAIRDRYARSGWSSGRLGWPVGPQQRNADRVGLTQRFQNGGIYWHPDLGACAVPQPLDAAYVRLGATAGALRYPTVGWPVGVDSAQHVGCQGGTVTWKSGVGAFGVYGGINGWWKHLGGVDSELGYPLEDEHDGDGLPEGAEPGREQEFEHGRMLWEDATGAYADPIYLTGNFAGGALETISGWVKLAIHANGHVVFSGHTHDSGLESYEYQVTAYTEPTNGTRVAALHHGVVAPIARDDVWEQTATNKTVALLWPRLRDARLVLAERHHGSIGGPITDAIDILRRMSITELADPGTMTVAFVIGQTVSVATTGGTQAGGRIIEGVLWGPGPHNTLLASQAHGNAVVGAKSRPLTDAEFEYLDRVFAGTLPRRRILLTDTLGGTGTAFTWPSLNRMITVNLGAFDYADPIKSDSGTLVHELTHAWQIRHWGETLYLTNSVKDGSRNYDYDEQDLGVKRWQDFLMEQQASIVEHWFGTAERHGFQSQKALNDPRFPYIQQNIRAGTT